jgi:hypothetical protein
MLVTPALCSAGVTNNATVMAAVVYRDRSMQINSKVILSYFWNGGYHTRRMIYFGQGSYLSNCHFVDCLGIILPKTSVETNSRGKKNPLPVVIVKKRNFEIQFRNSAIFGLVYFNPLFINK